MNDFEVDYELIRETFVRFGERMEALGFPKMLEDIEGSGRIGKCIRDPRDVSRIEILIKYLKGLGQELIKEERDLAAQGQTDPAITQAKAALEECYQTFKLCIVDTQSPSQATKIREKQVEAARKVIPTMRVPAKLPVSKQIVPQILPPAKHNTSAQIKRR